MRSPELIAWAAVAEAMAYGKEGRKGVGEAGDSIYPSPALLLLSLFLKIALQDGTRPGLRDGVTL